jgi:hypothetical protein
LANVLEKTEGGINGKMFKEVFGIHCSDIGEIQTICYISDDIDARQLFPVDVHPPFQNFVSRADMQKHAFSFRENQLSPPYLVSRSDTLSENSLEYFYIAIAVKLQPFRSAIKLWHPG